jgi:predicted alpha/beta-fold hydrolase
VGVFLTLWRWLSGMDGFRVDSCADSPLTTAQFYSAGFTEDMREVVRLQRARYPAAPLMAVGWSLGANILVNYVGEEGADCVLTSAVSLCNPFNLPVCNAALQKGFSKVYDWSLGSKLGSIFRCAFAQADCSRSETRLLEGGTLWIPV